MLSSSEPITHDSLRAAINMASRGTAPVSGARLVFFQQRRGQIEKLIAVAQQKQQHDGTVEYLDDLHDLISLYPWRKHSTRAL